MYVYAHLDIGVFILKSYLKVFVNNTILEMCST